ncbi:MAG: tetratricopeptide repeat protein [Gemmatimonadota bacterium]
MAAGIPGVGIGGLFYVLSAVAAPLRELTRRARGSTRDPLWAQAFRLCGMAVGIVIAMWLTGVVVGALLQLTAGSVRPGAGPLGIGSATSAWRISALALSVGTLTMVLCAVQVARLVVASSRKRAAARLERSLVLALLMATGVSATVTAPRSMRAQAPSRAVAAATVRDGEFARARQLQREGRTDAAIAVYEELVRTDPRDADAWQALAEVRRRAGRPREAISALEIAQGLNPTPRRGGQIDRWRHESGAQFEPTGGMTRDSDRNTTQRGGLAIRLPLVGRAAVTASASALRATNSLEYTGQSVSAQTATLGVLFRPRAALSIETSAGASQVRAASLSTGGTVASTYNTPVGLARMRWRSSATGPSVDLRATRVLIDATPLLVANRVVRTEGTASADVPLFASLRARATGRRGYINSADEPENTRTLLGASLVRRLPGWGDIALNAQRIRLARPTTQGYFAPREAQIAELSSYLERESDSGILLAIDAGVGMQRMQTFTAAALSTWQPAARLWTHLDVPLQRTIMLRAEVDVYDGGVAREAASAAHWRWISASLGVRLTP